MRVIYTLFAFSLIVVTLSCSKKDLIYVSKQDIVADASLRKPYKVTIDSAYAYQGDSLYRTMASEYYSSASQQNRLTINAASKSNSTMMTPEDEAFFSKKHTVTSTEAVIYHGRNYLYPGAILEGNSISNANYVPVFLQNREPITVSMSITHSPPKPTSRTIENPTFSKLDDYVKEMAYGGSFSQSERFMFQYRRFSFYDEIKQAFGIDIDTRKLFSSRSESSGSESHKILQSTGMYIKFFQSSFTVHMDIAPLSDGPIQGSSGKPPVYVSSVTYGRMGIMVLETDQEYQFAENCIKKEFDRIFYNRTETLTEEEQKFFEETQFKILIMGGDSDYTVQTFKGYSHFLNLIYNSTFTGTSYGVPIACSFSDANTHQLIETEFENTTYVEPLYVHVSKENVVYQPDADGINYYSSAQINLNFYKDREKSRTAYPYTDIFFELERYERNCIQTPNYQNWPEINMDCSDENELLKIRNIGLSNKIAVGNEYSSYQSNGPAPSDPSEPQRVWSAAEYYLTYNLRTSPFFIRVY